VCACARFARPLNIASAAPPDAKRASPAPIPLVFQQHRNGRRRGHGVVRPLLMEGKRAALRASSAFDRAVRSPEQGQRDPAGVARHQQRHVQGRPCSRGPSFFCRPVASGAGPRTRIGAHARRRGRLAHPARRRR
jgi:hypothetical protein